MAKRSMSGPRLPSAFPLYFRWTFLVNVENYDHHSDNLSTERQVILFFLTKHFFTCKNLKT